MLLEDALPAELARLDRNMPRPAQAGVPCRLCCMYMLIMQRAADLLGQAAPAAAPAHLIVVYGQLRGHMHILSGTKRLKLGAAGYHIALQLLHKTAGP